ncbi:endonuclease domain-containing protein [Pontibacter anaerobius]|uniref:Endonuclease domain-containing protein n=1 Tax=Pontibacter anaerobius TaxID=2993940 RepID=A0ABT3RKQ6_9BACT|nr:endonuclease domain-containing protein [Pontibacter anaerobius]MCX2741958.1 endonuclease domain-containing protein [Pontibacter anaerobius]
MPNLRQERSFLRCNMTPAEKELWRLLRKHKLAGRKFRRQHSIGSYIVDFYCAAEKLVLEVDGSVHDTPDAIANDLMRNETLQHLGYKVIRIRNSEVFEHPELVLQRIASMFSKNY